MIMKANKQIGFIYKNEESIDKILKDGEVVFERGFLREKTSTTLPITFGGVGKDLKDYRVYGNTYQNSTTGKNLLNYIDTIVSSGGGLTNVINEDGSITTTGVPTSNYRPIVNQYNIIDDLEDGQTYTISSETLNRFIYIQINAVKIAGGTDYIYNSNTRTQAFTVDKSKYNAYNIKIQTSTTSGWGSNSRTITNKYQLEKGATGTEFEPYTGGQPSPNPDYPQEIISCGDLITDTADVNYGKYKIPVNVKSDNIFSNNIIENGYLLEESGTITANSNYYICKETNIKPLSKYILSENQNYAVSTFTPVRVCAYDKNDNFIELLLNNRRTEAKRYIDEFVIPTNTDYILIGFRNSDTNIELVESIDTNIYLDEPLRKSLNNIYTDYIDFANKKIIRRNSMSVINVDNITLKSNYTNIEYASSPKPSDFIGYNSYNVHSTFCSHATYIVNPSNYDSKNNVGKFITGPERGNWWIGFPKGTGLTEIKSKLDGCEFVYILATPTEESITLPNIPTIDGNNTLNIETEITPSQVYIKYKSNE